MLCQQTSPKHWFANADMTSKCDITNSLYQVTMTTIRHWSILEIGRGAYNQVVAPGITRPLHAENENSTLALRLFMGLTILNLEGLGALFGGLSSPKDPGATGLVQTPAISAGWIIHDSINEPCSLLWGFIFVINHQVQAPLTLQHILINGYVFSKIVHGSPAVNPQL